MIILRTARNSIQVRGGVIGGQQIQGADLERVASTPSREQSIARIMGGINAPATRIAIDVERCCTQHRIHPGTGCRWQSEQRRSRSLINLLLCVSGRVTGGAFYHYS